MSAQSAPFDDITQALRARLPTPAAAAVAAFAAFGRAALAIARDGQLPLARRQALIDGLDSLLAGQKPQLPLALPVTAAARDLVLASQAAGVDLAHARHLLQALRQDCAKARYRDWGEWLLFARFAAAPYARVLIEATGETREALPAAEALACALLLFAQLQAVAADYGADGKVYLPERWLRESGATAEALAGHAAGSAWRGVFAEAARAGAQLLTAAAPLPGLLRHKALRGASAEALLLSRRWALRLAEGDPWAAPTRLSGLDRLRGRCAGAWRRFA
jgi:phytoene/squalene synthetase